MKTFEALLLTVAVFPLLTRGSFAISDEIEWTSFGGRELNLKEDISHDAQDQLEVFNKAQASERIVRGVAADRSRFRYFARLTYMHNGRLIYRCGGVLISDRFILTAAHCVWNMANDGLHPGGLTHSAYGAAVGYVCDHGDNCGHDFVSFPATHYWVHPEWDPQRFVLDIALVRLGRSVPSYVAVPAEPDLGPYFRGLTYGYEDNIQTVGYGVINDARILPAELQQLKLGYMPPEVCERYWGELNNGVICVYTNDHEHGLFGRGLCNGDSGSPAVIHRSDGPDVVIGVTSFGRGLCTEKKAPDVLARVSAAAKYIANVVCYPGMSEVAPQWCLRMGWGAGAQEPQDVDTYDAAGASFAPDSLGGIAFFADDTTDIVREENKVGQDMKVCQEDAYTTYLPDIMEPHKARECRKLTTKKPKKVQKRCTRVEDEQVGTVSDAGRKCCSTCEPYLRSKRSPFTKILERF